MANKHPTELRKYIEASNSILITSHISPDPDAVSSLLLLGQTLKLNYENKKIDLVLEEEPTGLEFLKGYSDIKITPVDAALSKSNHDLFVLLDGNNFDRCSRQNADAIRKYISDNPINTIVIDHHEPVGMDKVDIYINDNFPATVQNIYDVCFNKLKMNKPTSYAQTAMTGLYSDTGGFVYMKDGSQREVFDLASELVEAGADIEEIRSKLLNFDDDDMQILGELITNVRHEDGYTYSYLTDETVSDWIKKGKKQNELQRGTGAFLDEYIRNIGGRKWGFITYKNTLQGENYYSVSFRSLTGSKDVSIVANRLGGGGHKPAAGAKFIAKNIDDALTKIRQAIA